MPPLDDEAAAELLAALRAALSSISRRHEVTSASVEIVATDTDVTVVVTDDGTGPEPTDTTGSDIVDLTQRAAVCGGTATVVEGPWGGRVLTWRIPRPAARAST